MAENKNIITPVGDENKGGPRVNPLVNKAKMNTKVSPKINPDAKSLASYNAFIELDKLAKDQNKKGMAGRTVMANKGKYMVNANELRSGGAYINKAYGGGYIRKAAEGNIAMSPMGGMPPPPPSEERAGSVSPDMAQEAESLGITVAPPGATAEEVADDQLVLLSEGELVVPANVVRYHGLAQYEKMRKNALDGLNVMDQEGQLVSPQEEAPEGLLGPTMPEGAPV